MTRDRIRLAQFGVGRWGNHLLRNFLALAAVDVVAVVEPRRDQHEAIREKFQLAPAFNLTTDAEAVLADPAVDAVAIATPAATHYNLIKTALKHGKHVLAEKPLTLDVAECAELCQLAADNHVQLVIDHTYLFHPVVRQGAAVLSEQPLGTLRYGYATRTNLGPVRPDVDALWDLSIHDIAIFNHWLGETPIAVTAQGQTWLQSDLPAEPLFPAGLADVAWLRLFYPSGFEATIHVSWANPDKQRRLGLVGDRGALIFDEMQADAPLVIQCGEFTPDGIYFIPTNLSQEAIAIPPGEPLKQVCEHFVDCVVQQQPSPISSGQVGTGLVKVLVALSRSLNQAGQRVAVE
ncbi:Gfo/Idh/MocA family protein [Halomicronema sp. CCY15110]|uniref:Gfo/Idh/MocA family protein n=1 Tax=Halomicronema sp. CCY15110 TaxID=2767773 RepID=UPI00194F3AE8|nr:Gfo/Idh/MocA family oxidoreductase [Halomicronema sp. CCY15110]